MEIGSRSYRARVAARQLHIHLFNLPDLSLDFPRERRILGSGRIAQQVDLLRAALRLRWRWSCLGPKHSHNLIENGPVRAALEKIPPSLLLLPMPDSLDQLALFRILRGLGV